MRWQLMLLLVPAYAHAEHAPPPAPLVMPQLEPHTRLTVSPMLSTALLANELVFALSGTYTHEALQGLELFGDLRGRVAGVVDIGGGGASDDEGAALSNLRAGVRYHLATGAFRITPAVWGYAPTSSVSPADRVAWEQMSGVVDIHAFGRDLAAALGLSIDAGYYEAARFIQVEAGAWIVHDTRGHDSGPQIEEVSGAVGYGTQVTTRTSFLLELRVEETPERERLWGPAIGFGRGDGTSSSWHMRFHPYVFPGGEWGGLAIGLDFTHRWP